MDRHAPDALVTGYESPISGLQLPDPDDRHVLAAAIRGRADVIVTENLKYFPAEILLPLGIEAQHPDEFICSFRPDSRRCLQSSRTSPADAKEPAENN